MGFLEMCISWKKESLPIVNKCFYLQQPFSLILYLFLNPHVSSYALCQVSNHDDGFDSNEWQLTLFWLCYFFQRTIMHLMLHARCGRNPIMPFSIGWCFHDFYGRYIAILFYDMSSITVNSVVPIPLYLSMDLFHNGNGLFPCYSISCLAAKSSFTLT